MLDLDGFKEINDTHGHLAGDKALQIFGRLVRANVKGRDLAARFGGDEFTVLMPETELDGAQSLAEQIRRAVLGVELDTGAGTGARFRFTVSVGVTSYHRGESVEDFVKRADHALYLSKKRGRNCVTAFQ
jgi:diguanylate cyclase